jgi:hypothetical protein
MVLSEESEQTEEVGEDGRDTGSLKERVKVLLDREVGFLLGNESFPQDPSSNEDGGAFSELAIIYLGNLPFLIWRGIRIC